MSRSHRIPITKDHSSHYYDYWKIIRRSHNQVVRNFSTLAYERCVEAYNGPIRKIDWGWMFLDKFTEEPTFKDRRSIINQYDYCDYIIDHRLIGDDDWIKKRSRK
jgi:hypothetical protein